MQAALERGHEVTLFNRGQSNPDLFPGVERLRGDRNGDLSVLRGREWEAAFDPSAYFPRQVRATAEVLKDHIAHYTFVSSISVYPVPQKDKSETAPVIPLEDPSSEDVAKDYGALKAACEQVLIDILGAERVVASRSGLIVGPWDPTNRFTYWLTRVARGGEVLAPAGPDYRIQYIHARDQADFLIEGAERGLSGVFNVTGVPVTMGRFLETVRGVCRSDASFTWAPDAFLLEQEVGPWQELPLWIPSGAGALNDAPVERALAAGLRFRPLEQTVAETLEWARSNAGLPPPPAPPGVPRRLAGLDPEKEERVLAAWHARAGA